MKQNNVRVMIAMLSMVAVLGACTKETDPGVRPVVTSTDPVSNATGMPVNRKISATFNVELNASSVSASTFTVKQGANAVAGTVSYAGTTAMFTPSANLAVSTLYTATVSNAVKTTAGAGMINNYTWSFTSGTTPDTTVPTFASFDPAISGVAVSLNHTIGITFSEPMDVTTINSSTIKVTQGTTPVAGVITYSGNTATFTPSGNLKAGTVYTVNVTIGAKDMAGNAIASAAMYTFTTIPAPDTALPTVNSTGPLNGTTGVSRNKVLAAVFSEAMDPTTINANTFTVMQGSTPVAGTVAYSGTTATFTPSTNFAANTTYTATITTGAKDLVGNALAANIVWTFTTGLTASSLAAVNLGASANYVILAKTTVTNIATSAITGDLGLSPAATSFYTGFALTNNTGFATASQVSGRLYAADMAAPTPSNLTTAVNNMETAYTDAAGRTLPDFFELGTGNIGGRTLTPGLYKWTNSVTIPSDVTITGDATDVWIFQVAGNLTMSSAVRITLAGGAQAKNIFWQVAGQATMGTTSHFEGVILSQTGITFQTGASLTGRALAQTAVILDANAITKPQ